MDALQAVEKEETRLENKFDTCKKSLMKNIDELINDVQDIKDGLCKDVSENEVLTPLQLHVLSACSKKIKDVTSKIALDHKELHTYVSKVGKSIDRNFVSDFSGTTQEGIFSGDSTQLLNEAIVTHMLRKGQVDTVERFIEEADINMDDGDKEPFIELHNILNQCKNRNLEPALAWALGHQTELAAKGSSLEFKLHKLKFINLLRDDCHKEALQYSKIFSKFRHHSKEIQRLMCCFAFVKQGLTESPYCDLFDQVHWLDICDHIAKDACSLLGLSKTSPLEVTITAGCIALPTLLQIRQVMKQRQVEGMWSGKEELPVEINLDREFQFHSVFACPILRQQCGHSNPPMRLVCGHVISKDALQRLSHGNKLKCPYCPMEMDPRESKRIFF